MTSARVVICPYCGETQPAGDQCRACRGLFEPLSRQATHNEMGPWYVRDANRPFQPGCSYETLLKLIDRKIVTRYTIVRGPTTRQFWTIARRVPGIAHLFGVCHHCDASVDPEDHGCHACGAPFGAYLDRNYLGLPEVRPLPWEPDGDDAPMRERDQGSWGWINQPTGLSSFATNAELFGTARGAGDEKSGGDAGEGSQQFDSPGGSAPTPDAGRAALSEHAPRQSSHASGGRAGTMTAQDPAPTELATDDDRRLRSAEARVRTLQQHAARQARLTQLLAVVTIALAIGLVVFVVLFLRAAGGDGTMSATPPDATPNASSSPSPDDQVGPPAVLDPDADADTAPVDPDATLLPGGGDDESARDDESDAAPGRDSDDPSNTPSADESLADDLDLAAQHLDRASQAALPFAERAGLIESALSILAAALDVADDDAAQSRIKALIERAEAEQARLEVEALLGDPR